MKLSSKIALHLLCAMSVICICACSGNNEIRETLQSVESFIEEKPDSALAVLQNIDGKTLHKNADRAKYALLLSMALDKNYIDVTNDSIIAPAVKYYVHHGSADDKLKSNYYWGRIAMNAGDYEDAISRFTIAEKYVNNAKDKVAQGRLYRAQTTVYQYSYDAEAMIDAAGKTAELFMSLKDTTRFLASIFEVTAGYLSKVDTINAKINLDVVKKYWPSMDESQRSQYYANLLILNGHTSPSSLRGILKEYEGDVTDPRHMQWLAVAKAYYVCNEYGKALDAIEKYEYYGGSRTDTYFWIAGLIYESLNDSLQSMLCYKNYIEQTDDKLGYLLAADIRFVKERYENQIEKNKRNYLIAILVLCVLVLILSILLVVNKIKRMKIEHQTADERFKVEIARYEYMYNDALKEIDDLNDALKYNLLDNDVKKYIRERLNLLNKFIASNLTPNFTEKVAKELKQLMQDKKYFIESTRVSFSIEHPQFVNFLKKKGLSDSEIGYCCLYIMGLKGKDISSYMGSGHYKLSSVLRKKFGLSEHDTNIDIFLHEKLEEIEG